MLQPQLTRLSGWPMLRLRGQGASESCQSPSAGLTGWHENAVCEQAGGGNRKLGQDIKALENQVPPARRQPSGRGLNGS